MKVFPQGCGFRLSTDVVLNDFGKYYNFWHVETKTTPFLPSIKNLKFLIIDFSKNHKVILKSHFESEILIFLKKSVILLIESLKTLK